MSTANNNKLFPVNQLLEWLENTDKEYITIQSNDLSVLLAILKFANNETLECHPSIETISKITLKEKHRVRPVIKRLVKIGILSMEIRFDKSGDRDTNLYKYNPEMLWRVGAVCYLPVDYKRYLPVDNKRYLPVDNKRYLPWVTNVTHGGSQTLPLTNNRTNNRTIKKDFFDVKKCTVELEPSKKGSPLFEELKRR